MVDFRTAMVNFDNEENLKTYVKFDTNFIISKDVASRIGLKCKYEDIQNYRIRGRKEGMDLVKIYS